MVDRDPALDRLLDLDGFFADMGGGYSVRISAHQVPADAARPHGMAYTLTMHGPDGDRIFGIDNAHAVRPTRGPAGRSAATHDHLHRGDTIRPYHYRGADTLMDDFWREVIAILKEVKTE